MRVPAAAEDADRPPAGPAAGKNGQKNAPWPGCPEKRERVFLQEPPMEPRKKAAAARLLFCAGPASGQRMEQKGRTQRATGDGLRQRGRFQLPEGSAAAAAGSTGSSLTVEKMIWVWVLPKACSRLTNRSISRVPEKPARSTME